MAIDKPSNKEDEYFAKENADKRKKLRAEQDAKRKEERRQKAKETHWMKCPKCGAALEEVMRHDVAIDQCGECGGIWLDNGELELLCNTGGSGLLGKVFGKK